MSQSTDRLAETETPLVMVVDDSDDIREMVKFVLDVRGYQVVEAINGLEAVKIARMKCPDLILMDLSMPVLDGFDAARELRAITAMCNVPIVAMSAHDTNDHRARAVAVGFNEYVPKPIDFHHLINLIQNLLQVA